MGFLARGLALAVTATFPFTAAADPLEKAERCRALKTDAARLACYDSVFTPEADANKPDPRHTTGFTHWRVSSATSKLTDETNVFLQNEALATSPGPYGSAVRLALTLACRENETNFWIDFGGYFMSDYQYGTVTYRLDKEPVKQKRFRESSDHEALGLWSGGSAIPFLRSMFGNERLYVTATPYSESAIDAEFDISGLEEAIEPLRKACHW